MMIHCPVCGWTFCSEKSLRRHMAAHHSRGGAEARLPAAADLPSSAASGESAAAAFVSAVHSSPDWYS